MRTRKPRPDQSATPQAPVVIRHGRGRLRIKRPAPEAVFDLLTLVAREPLDSGMPEPSWPSGGAAFLTAVLRAQRVPEALAGPPGAGKTTLAAKLAARHARGTLRLVTGDGRRAGALAQLREIVL